MKKVKTIDEQPQLEAPAKKPNKPKAAPSKAVAIRHETPPQAPARAPSMLEIIGRAAADPRCDTAKMRELLDMQKDIEAEASKRAFTEAFIALSAELPEIRTDGRIEIRAKDAKGERTGAVQQATPYASFQGIMQVVKPLLIKHGFSLSFATEPSPDGTRIIVRGRLEHKGGHARETAFPLPAETSGSKNNVQGWGSSFSYGRRYCTLGLLNIVSRAREDVDRDGEEQTKEPPPPKFPPITEEQLDALVDLSDANGLTIQRLLSHLNANRPENHPTIGVLSALPAERFDDAKKAILEYARLVAEKQAGKK